MVNQAFRIKIAYRSKKEKKKEKEKEKEKIPGIGRYPMGPTKRSENSHQEESVKDCKAAENVDEAWLQVHFLFLREHQEADDVT